MAQISWHIILAAVWFSPIGEASTVEGHNAEGIAKYICLFLRSHLAFDLDEMLEGYDFTMNELADEIQYALEEIGFYKWKENDIMIFLLYVSQR